MLLKHVTFCCLFYFYIVTLLLFAKINCQSESKGHFINEWAVQINGSVEEARHLARQYGFILIDEVMPSIYRFRHNHVSKRSALRSHFFHDKLQDDPKVVWLQQQFAKVRVKRNRVYSNDPKWQRMWYLNSRNSNYSMNIMSAWRRGFAGQGVVVSILDDGIEKDHPDLKENYDPNASYDIISNDNNPEPRYISNNGTRTRDNHHGTRCAGQVAAARNNRVCGVGVAYRANVGGIRMLDGEVSDSVESQALRLFFQHIDVYSASWGPEDDGKTVDGPGELAKIAFEDGILKGRNGLGSIFVWASGNGGKNQDNCNCDGYTNSIFTLGVNAVSETGAAPWYAEKCSSTLAVTYSSGSMEEKAIITTDVNHRCTEHHSGTSASAPFAAGICALALSANRRLSWRDMQHLVVLTSRKANLRALDWSVNGAGYDYSHSFGFGLMDAGGMVARALNWTSMPEQRVCHLAPAMQGGPVTLKAYTNEALTLETDACSGLQHRRVRYLEHVQAKISLRSSKRGEVELWLISPSRTISKLLTKRPIDMTSAGFHHWPFMSVHFWGEIAHGNWQLTVYSYDAEVTLISWSLILYGTDVPPFYRQSPRRDGGRFRRPVKNVPREEENPYSYNQQQRHQQQQQNQMAWKQPYRGAPNQQQYQRYHPMNPSVQASSQREDNMPINPLTRPTHSAPALAQSFPLLLLTLLLVTIHNILAPQLH